MSLYALCPHSGIPLYRQIADRLRRLLGTIYRSGDGLPSENELAERFGVNRHTVRRAIDQLVVDGLLERRRGRGVFAMGSPLDYEVGACTRFTENLTALGFSTESRLLRRQAVAADGGVARRLELSAGTPVLWLETLRLVEGVPVCLISHFLPADRFADLLGCYRGGSLHRTLERRYGCRLRRIESLITAVLPQGDDARLLNMPQNRPVLRVKSVNADDRDGTPVEYAITRFRADRIQLRVIP